ncbi:hypothetical protein CYLTODRAFT_444123 [Cylindrobasidium torrendii FP15055 ss-10]|uniref:Uncharacterized protein n=1 Tax=Cylindrobasidium torrendii FP15055 ss-10 TaxID=1314674 RepID=A0A0D7BCJ8_9AGAR|nr:hypothetical protein CYLTODRAFT_444123 [Cylindrobasidium torrendii FP15055 ss-10]
MSLIARRAFRAAAPLRALPAAQRLSSTASEPIPTEYPKVPDTNRQHLPPRGWDDMFNRRNFNDPIHEQEELYSMWGPDIPPIAPHIALRRFGYAVLSFISVGTFIKFALVPDAPATRRDYPYGGLVTELGGVDELKARVEEDTEA